MKPSNGLKSALVLWSSLAVVCAVGFAAPADGTYKVRVAKDLKKDAAESLKNELKKEGYTPVDVNPSGSGFTVLVGAARSKAEAQTLVKDLKQAGFTPEDVEEPGAAATANAGGAPAGTDSAPPPGAEVQGAGSSAFRVLVHEFSSSDQADGGKQSLKNEGFTNVDVSAEEGKFKLFVGTFTKKTDAEALLGQVKNAGFAMAQVATVERHPDAKAAVAVPPPLAALPANLSDTQKADATSLLDKAKRANSGEMSGAEYLEFQKELQRQGADIKTLITAYEKQRGEQTEIQNKVWSLYREFESLLAAKRYDAARQKLEEVRGVDPKEPNLAAKQQRLEKQMAGGGEATANVASAPNTAGGAKPNGPKIDPEKVQQAIAEARKSEAAGNIAGAQAQYSKVLLLDPTNVEARGKVAELNDKQHPSDQSASSGSNQKWMYLGGGGALVLLLLGAYWRLARKEKKLEQEFAELKQHGVTATPTASPSMSMADTFVDPLAPGGMYSAGSTATAPAVGGFSGMASAGAGSKLSGGMEMAGMGSMIGGADDEEEEDVKPAPPPAEPEPDEAGNSDVVSISGLNFDSLGMGGDEHHETYEVEPEPPSSNMTPPRSDSLSLGDLDFGASNPSAPMQTSSPEPASAGPSMSLPDLDLDALLKGTFPGASSTSSEPEMPSARIEDISPVGLPSLADLGLGQEQKSINDELTLREMDSSGLAQAMGGMGVAPTVHIPTPFPAGAAVSSGGGGATSQTAPTPAKADGVHYEQTFDDEPVGSQPSDWKGDYDYASLTVDDRNSVDGTGRCLKFEKRSGAGSASYHCNFPNAAGQVTVEFDIRCDDKNKYLLGFYVEKDEDFKQSVHTIVHRIDSRSQPSLRIQGEPVPYELTTWRHVKYELNLLIGVVNAYVNDAHVVKDAKLPTIPAYVNTLSIRDNLATTGLLYLDNIRITRK